VSRATAPQPKKDPKTGTWWWVFDSQFPRPDGSRRQVKRRGFPTRAVAKAELQKAMAEDRPPSDLTVAQVLDRFVASKEKAGRAPNTIVSYKGAAARAKEKWGEWPAEMLTGDHLDASYTEWLASGKRKGGRRATVATGDGLSPRSVELIHVTIKAAYAMELRRRSTALRWNPADDATAPTVGEQKRLWWTPEQVGQFLAYDAQSDDLPTGLVDMLADTGGRRGEAVAVRWSNLHLDAGTLTVTHQLVVNKTTGDVEERPTKRPRDKATISLHSETVAKLKMRRREQAAERLLMGAGWPDPDDLSYDRVFTYPNGRVIRPDTLTRVIARMSVKAGLPRLTPHGLRHSFATAALKARVPVEVVAHRLGNTVAVVQDVYRHVIAAEDSEASRIVGDLYRRPPTPRRSDHGLSL
jgi:integrase